ncbi:TIGR04219 family outer membrane beta-barrel protein [Marinomonas balearica]|uniref:Outer membrane protein n=1 Tax=Marinomonas balearica TaxID=491947 RepID=A0A4R6M556_9GAMM|nr:TIGR04219 family outer membrane beta-barrel protein [Marinomonas balearica]TDO96468.1 outer membrane protein [Marinomonas balearica]
MRRALIASSLLLAGTAAQADVIGLTAEAGYFMPDATFDGSISGSSANKDLSGEDTGYFGIAFEHPIPLIPNVRLQGSSLETKSSGTQIKVDATDYTLYYEFLDGLLWLDLDAGISFRNMDVNASTGSSTAEESIVLPSGYVSAYVAIPGLPVKFGGELKTLSIGDSSITDMTYKVKYESPFFVGIEAGYRQAHFTIDEGSIDVKTEFDGAFIGAFVDF